MTPIVALTRIQLWGLLVGMGGRTRTRRRWSVAALVSIVSLSTLGLSGVYSFGLAALLGRVGAADLVLVIMPALAAFGAISAGTFGVSRSVLGGRDDTLLLSLPLHPRTIALAKLAAVALQNALLLVLVTVPAGLAYAGQVAVPGWFWPVLLAGALVLALGVTGLSMALALLITLVAPRRRGRTVVNVVILVATVALSLAPFPAAQRVRTLLASDPAAVREALRPWAWGFMALRDVAVDGSPGAAALLLALGLIPFVAVAWLVSVTYVPLLAGRTDVAPAARRVRIETLDVRSPFAALLRREAHRFLTSTIYVVNSGFGVVMLLAGAGWLLFSGGLPEPLRALAVALEVPLPILAAVTLVLPVSMTCTTAPSISLEGDRLWILRGAPLDPLEVLAAKATLNLLVVLPALLPAGLVLAVLSGAGPLDGLLILLIGILVTVAVAEFGLVTNLVWPVLDAPSDAVVVKQSVSVLAALVGGFVGCVALTGVGLVAAPAVGSTGALVLMVLAAGVTALLLFGVLRGWGVRAFGRLG